MSRRAATVRGHGWAALGVVALCGVAVARPAQPSAASNESGVEIVTLAVGQTLVEAVGWRPDGFAAVGLERDAGGLLREAVRAALRRLPDGYARSYVRRIVLVRSLSLADQRVGGTARDGVIVLSADLVGSPDVIDAYQAKFNHELAHLFLVSTIGRFPVEEWLAVTGLPYGGDALAGNLGGSRSGDRLELWEQGFADQLATASLEEDFAASFALLFCSGGIDWRAISAFPRLRCKLQLLAEHCVSEEPSLASVLRQQGVPPWGEVAVGEGPIAINLSQCGSW